ncbi:hypothetical protein WG66_012573, partial [Moniliophthora roreri]
MYSSSNTSYTAPGTYRRPDAITSNAVKPCPNLKYNANFQRNERELKHRCTPDGSPCRRRWG